MAVAPWLTDYSGYAGAGAAFQGFADALGKAQDRALTRQETQAKINAQQTQMQREKDQTQLEAQKIGMQPSQGGGFESADLTPMQQHEQNLKDFQAGAKTDASGNMSYDQESLKARMADLAIQRMSNTQQNARDRIDISRANFGEKQSQNAASAGKTIQDDSLIKDMATSRASLSRGRALLNSAQPLTYNNLNAVQQDVINGMTKGGQSSEGKVSREMQESWIGNFNNLMAKAGKYGPDNDIRKQDPGLAKQIGSLLEEVDGSIAQNMNDRRKALSGVYSQSTNPKVKATVNGLMQPEQGLVSPGLVTAPPQGKTGMTPAQKAARIQELEAKARGQ